MPFYEAKHRLDAEYFEIEMGEDMIFPPHVHRCYEVVLCTDGELELTVDGTVNRMQRGDIVLIFPNQVHAFHTARHSAHRLIIFSPDVIAAFDRHHTQQLPAEAKVSLGESHPVYPLLLELEREGGICAVKGALYSLCAAFERSVPFVPIRRERRNNVSLLREILDFVQRNFTEDCSLSALCAEIKYDMTYLSKFFKSQVGISFSSYVSQVRIAHACYLLLNTDKTVIQISHECGSVSLRTFNRNFSEQMGCTPSEYRTRGR